VSPQECEAECQKLLVKEKQMTRAHDALAAKPPSDPVFAVEKEYRLEGPDGPASLRWQHAYGCQAPTQDDPPPLFTT
jgi:predicted dithiol-disulfide oxidoreductase (DUF899 family)